MRTRCKFWHRSGAPSRSSATPLQPTCWQQSTRSRLTFRKDAIDFVCTTPLGKAADSCPCEGDGGDLEIGFNDHYLSDALKAAPADELNVCLNTGSSPCIFVPADGSDNFVYMVLPVRLRAGQ